MFKNKFENREEILSERKYIESMTPDIMKEQAITLLGTINAFLDNFEDLKFYVSEGHETPKEQINKRSYDRSIIDDHFQKIKIMLETGKIQLDDCLKFLDKDRQEKIKELFEIGPDNYTINNSLN